MGALVFFVALWGFCKALKAIRRAWANRPAYETEQDETEQDNPVVRNLAALDALQKQRAIYNDLLSDIDCRLDNAPATREKLLKDKAMIYSKLAIVESKISRLIG